MRSKILSIVLGMLVETRMASAVTLKGPGGPIPSPSARPLPPDGMKKRDLLGNYGPRWYIEVKTPWGGEDDSCDDSEQDGPTCTQSPHPIWKVDSLPTFYDEVIKEIWDISLRTASKKVGTKSYRHSFPWDDGGGSKMDVYWQLNQTTVGALSSYEDIRQIILDSIDSCYDAGGLTGFFGIKRPTFTFEMVLTAAPNEYPWHDVPSFYGARLAEDHPNSKYLYPPVETLRCNAHVSEEPTQGRASRSEVPVQTTSNLGSVTTSSIYMSITTPLADSSSSFRPLLNLSMPLTASSSSVVPGNHHSSPVHDLLPTISISSVRPIDSPVRSIDSTWTGWQITPTSSSSRHLITTAHTATSSHHGKKLRVF